MTYTYHLTRYDYTRGWQGPFIPRVNNVAYELVQGSTRTLSFIFTGDRTSSTWKSVINNVWKPDDTDASVLATAIINATFPVLLPDGITQGTQVTATYDGDDLNGIAPTQNVRTPQEAKVAVAGINYYVWEFLETPLSGLPFIFFTGYAELFPRADII